MPHTLFQTRILCGNLEEKTCMDIVQRPFCVEINRKNSARARAHLDQTRALFTLTVRTTVWGITNTTMRVAKNSLTGRQVLSHGSHGQIWSPKETRRSPAVRTDYHVEGPFGRRLQRSFAAFATDSFNPPVG